MATMINCPFCGKLTDPKLKSCPHCGGVIPKGGGEPELLGARPKKPEQTCPNCHAVVQEGDIICVACGTNLLTGHKVAEERKKQAAQVERRFPWAIVLAVAGLLAVIALIVLVMILTADPVGRGVGVVTSLSASAGDGEAQRKISVR